MDMAIVLSIVGVFLTIALSVNAFFLKGIFADLGDVKIKMAAFFENSKAKEEKIKELELKVKELEKTLIKVRERMHELGNLLNVLQGKIEG